MKIIQKYVAENGSEFTSADECELFEKDPDAHALVGLSIEDVLGIINAKVEYREKGLSVERIGRRIGKERTARGDKLREPSSTSGDSENADT